MFWCGALIVCKLSTFIFNEGCFKNTFASNNFFLAKMALFYTALLLFEQKRNGRTVTTMWFCF